MNQECVIRGANHGERLSLRAARPASEYDWSWSVAIAARGLQASADVVMDMSEYDFAALFSEMARDWRGWAGTKSWSALEGTFALAAEHDGLGHIALAVELSEGVMTDAWRVRCVVELEAGALGAIASEVEGFVAARGSVPQR